MNMHKNTIITMFLLLVFSSGCSSQEDKEPGTIDRQPFAAGRFYTSDKAKLKSDLAELFNKAESKKYDNVRAIICPHAGYVYSGEVAASSVNQIDRDAEYENIFIIASSHRVSFSGASIYYKGDYITPLGKVKVNKQLAENLVKENKILQFRKDAHSHEHSLEVELPLLQYHLKKDFKIVPIIMGTQNVNDCKKISKILKPYFNEKNLFVISTDFSHYPSYKDAVEIDKATADAIISNSVDNLSSLLQKNSEKDIPNLATSLCGWSSVFTLLYMTEDDPDIKYHELEYMNSGDQPFGDKNSVVGYWSIVVVNKNNKSNTGEFELSEQDKKNLLNIARSTIESYITNGEIPDINTEGFSENLFTHCGAFVTLNKKDRLRGCIGRFTPDEPLYKVVQQMAISASTQDYRFSPVTEQELDKITIEISVLTPLKKISSIDEIELGKHGIYIKKGYVSGTFLPQVAEQTGWSKEEFLGHCASDKARIGWDGWKDAEVYTYEAKVFSEKEY